MDDDAEALVDGLLGGDAQDARELVAQRAAAVGVDVGGGQREADALARQERDRASAPRATARSRALPARWRRRRVPLVARCAASVSSSVEVCEDLPLQRRGGGEQPRVDVGERVREALAVPGAGAARRASAARGSARRRGRCRGRCRAAARRGARRCARPRRAPPRAAARAACSSRSGSLASSSIGARVVAAPTLVRLRLLGLARSGALEARSRVRASGTTVARWRASSRVLARGRGAHELDREPLQPLEAGALLGGVLGGEQRAPRTPRRSIRRARKTSGASAVELGGGARGAARRSAGCVRAPRAAPAATRWRRRDRGRGRACAGGRPG